MQSTFPRKTQTVIDATKLAEQIGSYQTLISLEGKVIDSIASPKEAKKGCLVFCRLKNPEECQKVVEQTEASVVITPIPIKPREKQGLIVVDDPLGWYIQALNILFDSPETDFFKVHPTAIISEHASIAENVIIGAGVVVEAGCSVEVGCRIGSNSYLGPGTILGAGTVIQNNVSIGGVGLGYHFTAKGERLFFPHLGAVIIDRDVVVGSGSVIVRGQLSDTYIGKRCRIGNLVNIAHNVVINEDCAISSCTCIAGGTVMGARCNIAVGVKINAKITIGDDCQIGLGSIVTKSLEPGISVFGCPAKPVRTMKRF